MAVHRFSVGPSGQGENLGLVTKNNFYNNKELLRETELLSFVVHLLFLLEAGGSDACVPVAHASLWRARATHSKALTLQLKEDWGGPCALPKPLPRAVCAWLQPAPPDPIYPLRGLPPSCRSIPAVLRWRCHRLCRHCAPPPGSVLRRGNKMLLVVEFFSWRRQVFHSHRYK